MAGPSISEHQLKTRKEFYAYLDSKRKDGNSRFSLFLEKDSFCFSLYLLYTKRLRQAAIEMAKKKYGG